MFLSVVAVQILSSNVLVLQTVAFCKFDTALGLCWSDSVNKVSSYLKILFAHVSLSFHAGSCNT